MPAYPHFALNLVLSMSGFYVGWLLNHIRSIFVLPIPKTLHQQSKDKKLSQDSNLSPISEKLVSSALKNELPLEAEIEDETIEETDDDEPITISA